MMGEVCCNESALGHRVGTSQCGADCMSVYFAVVVHASASVVQDSLTSPCCLFLAIDQDPVVARVKEESGFCHYLLQQQYLNSAEDGVPGEVLGELQDLVPREPPQIPADDSHVG